MHTLRNRLLRTLLSRNAKYLLISAMMTVVTALSRFLTPAIIAELMDHYLGSKPSRLPEAFNQWVSAMAGPDFLRNNLWVFGLMIVLVSAISGTCSFIRGRMNAQGSENAALYLRERMYAHIESLPYNYHVKVDTGDLLQRCTSDINTVRRFLASQVVEVFGAVLMLAYAMMLMLPLNRRITLLSLSISPIIFLFSMYFFRIVTNSFRKADEAEAAMSTVLQENLTGVRVVRAFGQAHNEIEKFDAATLEHKRRGFHVADVEAIYWGFSSALGNLQIAISLVVCIFAAVSGEISAGDLVVFTGYTGTLMWPIRQLGRILTDSGKAMVALERLSEVLVTKPEPLESEAIKPPLTGDIVFEHVTFGYDSKPVLTDVSFTAPAGQTIALLGPTGSGKSSLVHLLQRLYAPQQGRILIGGVPIDRIDRHHLRQRVGLVLQDSFLYSKTIRENIAIAVPDATQQQIDQAAHTANALEFIEKSEKGYDTVVGERGVTLSGGQKQRVAIARTLMKQNDILIFDDSLSAVDTRTDAMIREALLNQPNPATTFIISHRISTLSRADQILVLEDGRVTAMGSHEELVNQPGLYQRIYRIQTGLEDNALSPRKEVG